MPRKSIFEMNAAAVYDALVQKAERKGKTRAEVEQITCWLTGYTAEQLAARLERGVDYGTLFREAPQINPKSKAVTGMICGVRVEEIEDPLMRRIRCLDKMIDELSKGKAMEKILRSGDEPQKNHIGLYPGEEAAAHFAGRLSDYAVSKGTIRLPYSKPLPLELIAEIAVWCAGRNT